MKKMYLLWQYGREDRDWYPICVSDDLAALEKKADEEAEKFYQRRLEQFEKSTDPYKPGVIPRENGEISPFCIDEVPLFPDAFPPGELT